MANKVYFPEVDAVKGIAILLVILGHSFCVYPIDLDSQFSELGAWVRSFQMPLFFIASGFVFSRAKSMHELLHKKFHRLFIPWLAFSVLSVALRIVFSSFTHSGRVDIWEAGSDIIQGKHYWFLYSLMCILLLVNLIKNNKVLWGLSLCSVVLGMYCNIVDFGYFTLGRTCYYLPFFMLGTAFRQLYGGGIQACLKKPNILMWLAVFTVAYVGFMMIRDTWSGIYRYMVPLAGSLLVWGIACLCKSKVRFLCQMQKVLGHFGRYSLQYYLNHLLIMLPIYILASKLPGIPMLQLVVIWILGIAVSWVMLMVQKRVRLFRMICGLRSE